MLRERMAGICETVGSSVLPTFLAFQEVTYNMRALLAAMAPWWGAYSWSPEPPPDVHDYVMLGCLPSSHSNLICPWHKAPLRNDQAGPGRSMWVE